MTYPKYETFDAINVDKVLDIPYNYKETMGVPILFLSYYNPNDFKIIGMLNGGTKSNQLDYGKAIVDGKELYTRILIMKK